MLCEDKNRLCAKPIRYEELCLEKISTSRISLVVVLLVYSVYPLDGLKSRTYGLLWLVCSISRQSFTLERKHWETRDNLDPGFREITRDEKYCLSQFKIRTFWALKIQFMEGFRS